MTDLAPLWRGFSLVHGRACGRAKSAGSRVREEREVNGGDNRPHKGPEGLVMVQVREKSRFGFCYSLGELIGETPTRYIYRNRAGTAFVSESPTIHSRAVPSCARTINRATRRLEAPLRAPAAGSIGYAKF
jgi:hypothetical protein